jgi:hypothetical protein
MKKVEYSERAKEPAEQFALVQNATKMLEEVVARHANEITAEWDKTKDSHGRPAYVLRISDDFGSASMIFSPGDLEPKNFLSYRLYGLWGDLLEVRSNRLRNELVGAAEGEG